MEWSGPQLDIDPYPVYARLREAGPVHHVPFRDGLDGWLVTRYDDARSVLADPRCSKDPRRAPDSWQHAGRGRPLEDRAVIGPHLLLADPPAHARLRRLAAQAFTPRRAEDLRGRVRQIAGGLLDRLADRLADRGEVDLIGAYAYPLAITVICELLGVPAGDRGSFRDWTTRIVSSPPGEADARPAALRDLGEYLTWLIDRKRRAPADDLVSALVAARDHEERLSEDELRSMVFLLLVAGHETTVNLIGNGVLALLRHPDQHRLLRDRPALLAPAVEELLRYDGPVELATWRFTTEPLHVGGMEVPAGQPVLVALASADRDPGRFPRPDALDLTRADNPHLAFGHGAHYCLGAALARVEGQVAIGALLQRFPRLGLAVGAERLRWRRSLIMRGLAELPVLLPG